MAATVTGLGGQGGERRQPRPGGSNTEDVSYFRRGGGVLLPALSTEIAAPQDAKLSPAPHGVQGSAPWPPSPLSRWIL